jgi:hypothetical protein
MPHPDAVEYHRLSEIGILEGLIRKARAARDDLIIMGYLDEGRAQNQVIGLLNDKLTSLTQEGASC